MLRIFSQMLKLPLEAFVFGIEMLARTMQGFQRLADQGINTVIGGTLRPSGNSDPADVADVSVTAGALADSAATTSQEESKMAESSLSNDQVKVVEYYILSIKPDEEKVLEGFPKVKVFRDNLTGADFASWAISEYFQQYPGAIKDQEDKKYVRVCYELICSFAPEDARYEKDQIGVLKEIREVLRDKVKVERDLVEATKGKYVSPKPGTKP